MDANKIVSNAITIVVVILLIAGCSAPKASSGNQDCPTAAACPPSAVQSAPNATPQVLPTMTGWQKYYNGFTNVRITYDPGKKCSMDILQPATDGSLFYEIFVNDQAYQNYMVAVLTLSEGKTLKDIEKYDQTTKGIGSPPPGSTLQMIDIVPAMSRTYHALPMQYSPIYFVCLIQGPDDQQAIEEFGPVEIKQ